jgi:hypothetical protein
MKKLRKNIIILGDENNICLEEVIENYYPKIGMLIEDTRGVKYFSSAFFKETIFKLDGSLNHESIKLAVAALKEPPQNFLLFLGGIENALFQSDEFCGLIKNYLSSENIFLMMINKESSHSFLDEIKDRPDTITVDMPEGNFCAITELVSEIEKAMEYVNIPNIAEIKGCKAIMNRANLDRREMEWFCTCNTFQQMRKFVPPGICRHVITLECLIANHLLRNKVV